MKSIKDQLHNRDRQWYQKIELYDQFPLPFNLYQYIISRDRLSELIRERIRKNEIYKR
jgi:hypothetical protein